MQDKEIKPKYNMFQNSRYMFSVAWIHCKSVIWFSLLLAVLAVLSNLLSLYVTPAILAKIESVVSAKQLIIAILLYVGGMMIVRTLESYISTNVLFGRMAVRIVLVSRINEKISITSYPNTENQDVRKKLEKAKMSVDHNGTATEEIWSTLSNLLRDIIGFIIYVALLSTLELWIVATVLLTSILGFFINKRINEWGYRHRDEEAEYSRRMNYISKKSDNYTLAKDIRIFGMQPWLNSMYKSALHLYQSFIARGEKVYIWSDIINVILNLVRNGVAYAYLIYLVINNGLSVSQFLLFFSVIGGFSSWVNGILSGFSQLHKQGLDISSVREFLEYPEPFLFEDGEPLKPVKGQHYQIELKNVSFRHPGSDKYVLKNINLIIKASEKLAIVGLNGAGKTTLVKLICGFYNPSEGEVLLNGENINKYNRRDYYLHFSAVFQDYSILAASVAENIAQTKQWFNMIKMVECVEKAGMDVRIERLPNKYETHMCKDVYEDGIELSGGETQRLLLARALYKDAPIIILDEPTAALDPIAESEIYNKYNELTQLCTSLFISHRLASTLFCDRIILLENGIILEEGTHHALMKFGGKYASLFEVQSHYYQDILL